MRQRLTARVLLFDPDDRILLMKGRLPGAQQVAPSWFTVGGGAEPGETAREAAAREIVEETGITAFELGPTIWRRDGPLPLAGGELVLGFFEPVLHLLALGLRFLLHLGDARLAPLQTRGEIVGALLRARPLLSDRVVSLLNARVGLLQLRLRLCPNLVSLTRERLLHLGRLLEHRRLLEQLFFSPIELA